MKKITVLVCVMGMLLMVGCSKQKEVIMSTELLNEEQAGTGIVDDKNPDSSVEEDVTGTMTQSPTPLPTATSVPSPTPIPTPTITPIPYDYKGVIEKNGMLYYYTDGKADINYEGLGEHEGQWMYFKNGTVDMSFTGVTYKNDGMWYVNKGVVDITYCGEADFLGRTVEVINGRINSDLVIEPEEQKLLTVEDGELEEVYNKKFRLGDDTDTEKEQKFTTSKEGIYWIINTVEGDSHLDKPEWRLLDCFGNELHRDVTYSVSSTAGTELNSTVSMVLPEDITYRMITSFEPYYYDGGINRTRIVYVGKTIDVSNFNIVKDQFDESLHMYMEKDQGTFDFVVYTFIPDETVDCTIWFDDINISKNKNVYKDNWIFDVFITGKGAPEGGNIYSLSSENTAKQFTAIAGEEYCIALSLGSSSTTERYRNGDVEYTMHISQKPIDVNITGYTSVADFIAYGGTRNINKYTLTPVRKETISFTLSQMREDATVDIKVKDSTGNIIVEDIGLKNGDSFELTDTLKNNEYTIEVIGSRDTNYYLDIEYR